MAKLSTSQLYHYCGPMKEVLFFIFPTMIGNVYMLFPKTYEAHFTSLNSSGDEYWDFSQIRFLGRDHRANGTVFLKEDLDDEFLSISAESYFDSTGDGEYKKMPLSIPLQPVCKVLKSHWSLYDASLKYKVNTDIPVKVRPCPVPKGIYYFKDVVIKTDDWPTIMPRGYVKGVAKLFKNGENVARLEVISHITDIA